MKAIVIHRYGPPDVLKYEDRAGPRAARRAKSASAIHAATVNRVLDVSVRAGKEARSRSPSFRSSRASIAPASSMRSDPRSRDGERECGSPPPA